MSGRKYPTAKLYLKFVWRIQYLLTNYANSDDVHLSDMAKRMRIKFDKYWETYNLILSFAAILDHRYKLPFIKYCFNELEPEVVEWKSNFIKDKLYELYVEYEKKVLGELCATLYIRHMMNSLAFQTLMMVVL